MEANKVEDDNEITEYEIIQFRRCFNPSEESIEKYKMYGPANPLVSKFDGTEDLRCSFSSDGICYMMTCRCLEYDEDVDEYNDDWFVGICLECDKKIEDRKDAWRIPDIYGAFIGCYCEDHFKSKFDGTDDVRHRSLCKVIECIRNKFPINKLLTGYQLLGDSNIEEDELPF